jgi:hypothetical protein
MAGPSFSWVCPRCKEEYKLRERATVGKRYCRTCKIEIRTQDIDRQMLQREVKQGLAEIASHMAVVKNNTAFISVRLDTITKIKGILAGLTRRAASDADFADIQNDLRGTSREVNKMEASFLQGIYDRLAEEEHQAREKEVYNSAEAIERRKQYETRRATIAQRIEENRRKAIE